MSPLVESFPALLYAFSEAEENVLKGKCGGAWQSYFQRGNWRMVFPLSRNQQEKTAARLLSALNQNLPPVVHVVRFPQLSINHAMLVFEARETEQEIQFSAYDPNNPGQPVQLVFNRAERRFSLPPTRYFIGGRVDLYQVYSAWDY